MITCRSWSSGEATFHNIFIHFLKDKTSGLCHMWVADCGVVSCSVGSGSSFLLSLIYTIELDLLL